MTVPISFSSGIVRMNFEMSAEMMKHFIPLIAVAALMGCGKKKAAAPPAEKVAAIKKASDEAQANAFVNTLGMKFVPVPGTKVQFCIWETRVKDYAAYAAANTEVDAN